MGLRQPNDRGDGVDRGQHAGDVERDVRTTECRQSADRRAEHEADAERGTEQPDQARPLRLRRQVGDCGLGDRQAAARRAVDDSPGEQQPQHAGGTGDEAADRRAEQRDDDDRLAPDAIRQPPEQRRAQQLGQRERGEQQADVSPEAPNRSA